MNDEPRDDLLVACGSGSLAAESSPLSHSAGDAEPGRKLPDRESRPAPVNLLNHFIHLTSLAFFGFDVELPLSMY